MTKIAKGQAKKADFMRQMIDFTQKSISDIKKSDQKFKHDNISGKVCSECGKPMLEVNGKRGKMLVCSDRTCGNKKKYPQLRMRAVQYAIKIRITWRRRRTYFRM